MCQKRQHNIARKSNTAIHEGYSCHVYRTLTHTEILLTCQIKSQGIIATQHNSTQTFHFLSLKITWKPVVDKDLRSQHLDKKNF